MIKTLACEALINLDQPIIAKNALIPILRYSYFADDAKILLALIENTKEASTQAITIILEKIQKKSSMLLQYILYLPKLGEKELAVSLLLDTLTSPWANEKEKHWRFKLCIDALTELECKKEIFLDSLIDLSTDSKTDFLRQIHSFRAMLEFENINETQAEKLLTFSRSNNKWLKNICVAGVLTNFQKTEDLGADLLIRLLNSKLITLGLAKICELFTQNKRLAFNSKFCKMLYDIPNKNWETKSCLTVIKMLQKAEQ